jgi:hypothetical protein
METLAQGAIRFRHLGDLREHGAFPFRLVLVRARGRLQFLGALLHSGSFAVRESLDLLAGRGGAFGGLLRGLLGGALTLGHENLLTFKLLDYGLLIPFYPNVEREWIKMTNEEFSIQILII